MDNKRKRYRNPDADRVKWHKDKSWILFFLESHQQVFFFHLVVVARFDWRVSYFSWDITVPVNMRTNKLPHWNEKRNVYFCCQSSKPQHFSVPSSNDNVRRNEPRRVFWARVLRPTSWRTHVGVRGGEEASWWLRVTTTRAPRSQDFFSERDSITSSGWHIRMADAHRRTMFLFKWCN